MKLTPIFLALAISSPLAAPSVLQARPLRAADSLHSWVKRNQSEQFYGVYIMNRKVGWMSVSSALSRQNGRPVALQSTRGSLRVGRGAQSTGMQFLDETTFSLQGDGPILKSVERMTQDGKTTAYQLTRGARGYQLQSWSSGRTTRKIVGAPRETLRQSRDLERWLRVQNRPGAKISQFSTSLDAAERDTRIEMVYLGRKTIAWGGISLPVHRVRMNLQGSGFEADVKSDGMLLNGRMGSVFEMRAEEEKSAKKPGQGVDMMAASSVRVQTHLLDARLYQSLTLDAQGLGDFRLPQSKRQRVVKTATGWRVEMKPDAPGNSPEKLSSTARAQYLIETPAMPIGDAQIVRLARQIVGKERAPIARASKLRAWIYRNLRKTMASNASTATEVLATKAGDCTEHALLFVTLARALGLPAREVTGLAYLDGLQPLFGWHAWAEIHDGKEWVSIDPMWDETWVDASHIVFARGSDDLAWTNVMGSLKLKIVAAKRS